MKKTVNSALSAWKRNHQDQNLRKVYHNTKAAWKRLIRAKKFEAQRKWNSEISKQAKSNPKSFWNLLKSKSKPANEISNNITTSKWEQHFKGLYSEATPTHPPSKPINHNPTSNMEGDNTIPCDDSLSTDQVYLNELVISEISLPEIGNAILKLKSGKSAGADKITNEVLKCLPPSHG